LRTSRAFWTRQRILCSDRRGILDIKFIGIYCVYRQGQGFLDNINDLL
jgi:hypothetical protein